MDSLRLIAAPAPVQRRVLPAFVVVTDEIMSAFEDAFLLLPQLEGSGALSAEAAAKVRDLDAHLVAVPADGSIEDPATLDWHDFWNQARRLAVDALQALDEEVRPPEFEGIAWVEGVARST